MKKITTIIALAATTLFLGACGSKKEANASLSGKKAELEKLKKERSDKDEAIKRLQEEIRSLDTSAASEVKAKLVTTSPVSIQDFKHYIDLRGSIDADGVSYISPRGMGGQVKAVYVKQGQMVRKGQLLLKLDDAIARQSVIAVRQQMDGVKSQLALARSVYERRQNLWKKGVGTEIELMNAKTTVESLEAQLKSINEQANVAVEQMNTANVYSDVNGVADVVNIRVGELFQGVTQMGPQIKIVNKSSLKVVANVPENYMSRIKTGTPVVVNISDLNKTINTSVSLISQSIDPTQRGFVAEAKIPTDPSLKPDQSVVMKILDYSADKALVIPVNTVQSDEKNKYVYVLEKSGNGKSYARRKTINIGETYGDMVEVKTGIAEGDQLITEGFQNLYEGQVVTTEIK